MEVIMRLRKKPDAEQFIFSHPEYVIIDPKSNFGKIHTLFMKNQPLHIEIGMGKGDFIIGMAKKYPKINFVGIEKYDSVLYVALKKVLEEESIPNLKLMRADAVDLKEFFSEGEVSKIYLNFSDPWPKKRHYKRRLTYKDFLSIYEHILVTNGIIEQKTDNLILFESSLVSMNQYPMDFLKVNLDLHESQEDMVDNVMTEYERKFSPTRPIYRLVAQFKGGNTDGSI